MRSRMDKASPRRHTSSVAWRLQDESTSARNDSCLLFKFAKHEQKKMKRTYMPRKIAKNLFGTRDMQHNFVTLQYTFLPERFASPSPSRLIANYFLEASTPAARLQLLFALVFLLRANLISAVLFLPGLARSSVFLSALWRSSDSENYGAIYMIFFVRLSSLSGYNFIDGSFFLLGMFWYMKEGPQSIDFDISFAYFITGRACPKTKCQKNAKTSRQFTMLRS